MTEADRLALRHKRLLELLIDAGMEPLYTPATDTGLPVRVHLHSDFIVTLSVETLDLLEESDPSRSEAYLQQVFSSAARQTIDAWSTTSRKAYNALQTFRGEMIHDRAGIGGQKDKRTEAPVTGDVVED